MNDHVDAGFESRTGRCSDGCLSDCSDQAAALLCVADAINGLAASVQRLGNADASTHMGGLEALGKVLAEGMSGVASALSERPNPFLIIKQGEE